VTRSPVIVALDFPDAAGAQALADRLDPAACRVKVGNELFTAAGPSLVEALQRSGFEVFLDLKFHDIPNTVAGGVRSAGALGVWMVNVHAVGGRRMLEAAAGAREQCARPPLLIGVTMLTSLDEADYAELAYRDSLGDQVSRLAGLCASTGLDGVVCSAREAKELRSQQGEDFVLVTPGIRPADSPRDDQRRVLTPAAALAAGSSYLVIGRPVTAAADPLAALTAINTSIDAGS
jgi:orotidine-5'-phosphate decarboxylase